MTSRRAARPAPSKVDEEICVGCRQCAADCPFEAIEMVSRGDSPLRVRSDEVARVDPDRCVSCGICAGSCAPMGVGPTGRTGRDQLSVVRAFIARLEWQRGAIIVVGCDRPGDGLMRALHERAAERGAEAGVPRPVEAYPVDCAGSLHTSVIELLVRAGAGGVLVLACPPRDCWNREGPAWLAERMYHDREAELQARVDRSRVRIAHADVHDEAEMRRAIDAFAADLALLDAPRTDTALDVTTECVPVVLEAK